MRRVEASLNDVEQFLSRISHDHTPSSPGRPEPIRLPNGSAKEEQEVLADVESFLADAGKTTSAM
jgi:hypothetical protein